MKLTPFYILTVTTTLEKLTRKLLRGRDSRYVSVGIGEAEITAKFTAWFVGPHNLSSITIRSEE